MSNSSISTNKDKSWKISEVSGLHEFQFPRDLLEKALKEFMSDVNEEKLVAILQDAKEIKLVKMSGGILTIHCKTEVLKIHKRRRSINERMGLIDRIYIREDGISPEEFVLKVYKNDSRDEPRDNSKPIYVLGVTRHGHDSMAVLLKDGKVLGAIEEERLNRNKHSEDAFPFESVTYLLDAHKVKWADIAHIATTFDYNFFVNTPNSSAPIVAFGEKVKEELGPTDIERRIDKYRPEKFENLIKIMAGKQSSEYVPPVTFVRHHKSHAVSGWNTSPFKDVPTLIVSLDGMGEEDATSIWYGSNGKMKEVSNTIYPHSLGLVYAIVTKYLGYKAEEDEGIVMGLAPFGKADGDNEENRITKLRAFFNELVIFDKNTGGIKVNTDFLDATKSSFKEMLFSENKLKILESIGIPTVSLGELGSKIDPNIPEHRPYVNFAYVLQERTEEVVVELTKYYLNENPQTRNAKHLILVGGVALNVKANGRLVSDGVIEQDRLYIPAFPGDDGSPIGAACSVSEEECVLDTFNKFGHVSLGRTYSDKEIQITLDEFGLKKGIDYERLSTDDELIERVANLLNKGETLAWFQGGSELGPRALGNRSILHLLSDPEGNNIVNRVKKREWWRPSAPSVKKEAASDYLEGVVDSPFMTITFKVKPDMRSVFVSGIHPCPGDNTARVQTVSRDTNPLYWSLLDRIGRFENGLPGLLNTSFNTQEPIVETPENALNTLVNTNELNILAMGHFIIWKKDGLLPSVLSIGEDETKSIFEEIITEDSFDDEKWLKLLSLLEDQVRRRKISHYRYLSLELADKSGKNSVMRIPIFKEMFQRKLQNTIVSYISRQLSKNVDSNESISVVVTSPVYQSVFLKMFQDFVSPNSNMIFYSEKPLTTFRNSKAIGISLKHRVSKFISHFLGR